MPAEDRDSHEKRQDKNRVSIQQTKYQMRYNRQNKEQATAILWTPESDEGWKIPQDSVKWLDLCIIHGA